MYSVEDITFDGDLLELWDLAMSITVMMTSAASKLAQHTQRVAVARGDIHRANIERIETLQKAQRIKHLAPAGDFEPYVPSGDPFESGASIWDVLNTIRHANGK
jgi:hypothetical protein